ncbi:MAG: hypothetical protein QM781_04885 [Chitinophagaceae bacterium]
MKEEYFEESHRECWEKPEKYALVKENHNGVEFYSVFSVGAVLMVTLYDDFEYALKLAKKMIENGVRVFEDVKDLLEWYNKQKSAE